MTDSINKGRIATEIQGFGGVYYRRYSPSHRFESPCQSGTTVFIPLRSRTTPNLRILGTMLTFH